MEPPGPAMPPGYRHRQKKSWTPTQANGILNTYLMVPGRIRYKNSTAGPRPRVSTSGIERRPPRHSASPTTRPLTTTGWARRPVQHQKAGTPMSSISIIGLGNMASALAGRALAGGNAVEVIGRDAAKAKDLAAALGGGATAGTFGTAPAGDIVILAVPYASAVPVVAQYAGAVAGKVIIDISNTFNAEATGLVTPDGTSGAQEIAKAAPASAHVMKAFNTVFGHVLAQGRPLDVLIAGDDARAKASVSAFIESLGLRPLDTGDLAMAHWLEGVGPLLMARARHGAGFNIALGVNVSGGAHPPPPLQRRA